MGLVETDSRRLWEICGDHNSYSSSSSSTTPPETKPVGKYEVAPHKKPDGRTHAWKFNGNTSYGDSKRSLKTTAAGEVETLAFVRNIYRRYLREARALEVHRINYRDTPGIYLLSGTPTIQPSLLRPAMRKVGCNAFRWETFQPQYCSTVIAKQMNKSHSNQQWKNANNKSNTYVQLKAGAGMLFLSCSTCLNMHESLILNVVQSLCH